MKIRLDEFLSQNFPVQSRSQARGLIKDGAVLVNSTPATKPGQLILPTTKIEITRPLYVARSAFKLKEALEQFQISPAEKVCLDIGASTGGFTQILLEKDARQVFAVDVGRDQLHPTLRDNPKIQNLEQTDLRDLAPLNPKAEFCTIDVSFISLKKILPHLAKHLSSTAPIIALFKPQFEVGPKNVSASGIVKLATAQKALQEFKNWCQKNDLKVINSTKCSTKGKTGNQEFLLQLELV